MNVMMVMLLVASLPFTSIAKGSMSEQDTPRQAVARTPAEWQALWKDASTSGPLPVVDFASRMVVGVFLGVEPSTGYEVEIVGVKTDGDALVVEYVQHQPGRDMMTAQMITQPFHLVAVPRHADPVRFVRVADVPPPSATRK
jgi:hypothetical protein